jgi:hypothetical protein
MQTNECTYPGVGKYCNAVDIMDESSSIVVSSLVDENRSCSNIVQIRTIDIEHVKNIYTSVIDACLNGNIVALGLPDAKLMVDGGDRASNCARRFRTTCLCVMRQSHTHLLHVWRSAVDEALLD